MADLDAGATGTMPSALLPDLIRPVLAHHRAGRRREAAAAYARILPLINFENRQCGLRATKTVMAAGGVIESDAVRHPLEALHPATRAACWNLRRNCSRSRCAGESEARPAGSPRTSEPDIRARKAPMKYRLLPGTQLNVSEVCLGTMTWGEQNSEAEGHAQLDYAVAQGVNFIDTAEMYPVPPRAATQGRTESILGTWLARSRRRATISSSRPRWRVRVAASGFAAAAPTSRATSSPKRSTRASRGLRIDHIDLYQIHWPQRNVPMFGATEFDPAKETQGPSIREQVEGMAAMIKAGKIRHYGLSNETAWGVCEFQRVRRNWAFPVRSRSRTATAWFRAMSTTISPKCCTASRCRCSPTVRSPPACCPASTWAGRSRRCTLHAVRRDGPALSQADRARGGRGVCGTRRGSAA